jgi:hypothetical protein
LDLAIKELRQTPVDWQLELYSGADHIFTTPDTPGQRASQCPGVGGNQKIFGEVFKN